MKDPLIVKWPDDMDEEEDYVFPCHTSLVTRKILRKNLGITGGDEDSDDDEGNKDSVK